MRTTALRARLADIVGPRHLLTDPETTAGYVRDYTGRYQGEAHCVVRPGSSEEVAAVVTACAEAGVALVPQGGNTGLVGGAIAERHEVLLSITRLDWLGPVDRGAAEVAVGAGATLAAVQGHARKSGLAFGVDFAARDSATVGGAISTNAGGVYTVRHGAMHAQVVSLEAVTAQGSEVGRLSGPAKDTAGYDLAQLLIGSEGTLGVVTGARLRLVSHLPERVAALVAVQDVGAAISLLEAVRVADPALEAIELVIADCFALVTRRFGLPDPFAASAGAYVLLECAAAEDPTESLAESLEGVAGLLEVVVAQGATQRVALWRYRELLTEAVGTCGEPQKFDVGVPVRQVPAVVEELAPVVRRVAPGAQISLWGHLAEGNLHVNVVGGSSVGTGLAQAVLELVAEYGGTVSAEHGVGVAKRRFLHLSRSPQELSQMRAVKSALDPSSTLNPRVVLSTADC